MAAENPTDIWDSIQAKTTQAISTHFPIEGRTRKLVLHGISVDDKADSPHYDIRSQEAAKNGKKTWGAPVIGDIGLVDKATGREIDRTKIKLLTLPKPTNRYSYIVDGGEWQVDNLWRLKSGVYAHAKQNGQLQAEFNLAKPFARESRLYVPFDPSTKAFKLKYAQTHVPLYSILKTLGVQDEDMKKAWGEKIYKVNATPKIEKNVQAFYGRLNKRGVKADGTGAGAAAAAIAREFDKTRLLPETTKAVFGKPIDRVSGEALLLASKRILEVARGDRPQDDRDSLIFKQLHSVEDFIHDKLSNHKTLRAVTAKVGNNIDRQSKVRDIVSGDLFGKPVKEFFTTSTLSRNPEQVNPLEMLTGHRATTIIGGDEGGIKNEQTITGSMKLINPSHFGFLDPVHGPESERTGINLHLPLGVKKINGEAKARVYDLETHKTTWVTPAEMHSSHVLLPDQVTWEKDKPHPISDLVKMKDPVSHEIVPKPFKEAKYLLLSPHQLFDEATNLIPFLQNNQGNRAMTAARQQTQAVGLAHREQPLVQVKAGPDLTWERVVGVPFSHTAHVDGTVSEIKKAEHNGQPEAIVIKDTAGKRHEIQVYNNFPLNDSKSFLHSTPVVKVGDAVKKGQTIADSNFTRDGRLALGTNLRVGYIPYKGYNFEDGIVISESAAKSLSSEHLHRKSLELDPEKDFMSKAKFTAYAPTVAKTFTKEQADKIDADGVIRIGSQVRPGDVLIAAVGKRDLAGETGRMLGRLSKRGFDLQDKSISWDSEHPGEVVNVIKDANGRGATVHIRTIEPMEIGDKLVGRHGNKCFDDQTEILTEEGWKYFTNLSGGERVATRNQLTGAIEYHCPTNYIAERYNGEMYLFQGRRLDLCVTPNHNHWVRGRADRGTAEGTWRFETSRQVFGKQRVHQRTGMWVGQELESVEIPGRPHDGRQHFKFAESRHYDADDFLEFFGYWVTEGSVGQGKIHIAQRRSVNPDIYQQIVECVYRLGYEPGQYDDVIVFSDPRLAIWLEQFGTSKQKYLPRSFMQVSQRQMRILADALFAGDGGVYFREKDNHTRYELYTSSQRLADDYQEIALKLGFSANIKQGLDDRKVIRWSLSPEVWTAKDRRYGEKEQWVAYDGMVYCVEVKNHLIYVRRNGIPVWSGNSIVTKILPDREMPRIGGPDGQHIEVAMNPSGIASRINLGQMLETAASKIADKTGQPYIVNNFGGGPDQDFTKKVRNDLEKHGLKDVETLYDPLSGKPLGEALTGKQYIVKLKHQVEKKLAVRSHSQSYTIDQAPKGTGANHPGQGVGQLEFYALLAHGARANLRDMATYKADRQLDEQQNPMAHIDFWHRVQMGQPLPAPKPTFAYKKFEALLTGLGVNVRKEGNSLQLTPLTDRGVLGMSKGEIQDPGRVLRGKDAKELEKGLFDPKVTGGLPNDVGKGLHWSHISLAEPFPNPLFVGTKQHVGPLPILTGLKFDEFENIAKGRTYVNGKTGGQAITDMLKKLDVGTELKKSKDGLATLRGTELDNANRKVRFLQALDSLHMKPQDAYMMNHVPVLPPIFRPIVTLPNGALRFDDVNYLYRNLGIVNDKLKAPIKELGDKASQPLREQTYDLLRSLAGLGGTPAYESNRQLKGILDTIAGDQPKSGFFQSNLMKRRQELSMRSTITPDPTMHLDYVGLPKNAALELYKPFVIKELQVSGYKPVEAMKQVKEQTPQAFQALQRAMDQRPVLLKRDPALHKFSVMAFKPKIVEGRAIQIHPLVTAGFSADFDGNCFVGETKVVIKFADRAYHLSSREHLERDYAVKFTADTVIIGRDEDGLIVETRIDSLPALPGTPQKDKNGALVYRTPPGMSVWTYDHQTGKPIFAAVERLTREDNCEVATVETRGGYSVGASLNESLCVYDHVTEEVVEISPENAVGRLAPVLASLPISGLQYGAEFGWMLGAYVSNGFLQGRSAIGYSKVSDAHRERFAAAANAFEGRVLRRNTFRDEHSHEAGASISGPSVKDHLYDSTHCLALFRSCTHPDRENAPENRAALYKQMPNLGRFSEPTLVGILAGLFDGDGFAGQVRASDKQKSQIQVSFYTSSKYLVEDLILLGKTLGIRVNYSSYGPSPGRLQKHTAFTVFFSTPDLQRYASRLGALSVSEKTRDLFDQLAASQLKDDRDIVPVPLRIMEICASSAGPVCVPDRALFKTLQTAKSTKKSGYYVSRTTARRMLALLQRARIDVGRWSTVVESVDTHWDIIKTVTPRGVEAVYDLEVPQTKIFAVNGGLVVWDTMAAFVPLSEDAVREAHKMLPSNNLFSATTGSIMYSPDQESLMGLHLLSRWGKPSGKSFHTYQEAQKAKDKGSIGMTDVIKVGGKDTTLGRLTIVQHLPDQFKHNTDLLHNPDLTLVKHGNSKSPNRLGVHDLLEDIARRDPKAFAQTVDALKNLGNEYSYDQAFSFRLKDLDVHKELREKILKPYHAEAAKVRAGKAAQVDKDEKLVDIYTRATDELSKANKPLYQKANNNIFSMVDTGARGKWAQFRQMNIAPMLMKDGSGKTLPNPVTKSYSEGLDIGDYWTTLHGARMGTLQKVEGTSEPGRLSKEILNVMMPNLVVSKDCGTHNGISMDIHEDDVHDRFLASPVKIAGHIVGAGTLVTPQLTSQLKKAKIDRIVVRSPLKCSHGQGFCAKCYGLNENGHLHDVGTNVGVIAGQALGEPATQLSMKSFHSGGVAGGAGAGAIDEFARLNQILEAPKILPGAALLATSAGKVQKVVRDAATNGWHVFVGGEKHFTPARQPPVVKAGDEVRKGQPLTHGPIDPHHLLGLTDIHAVQNYMTNELSGIYRSAGVKRRNIETVVRSLTNLTKIKDPGDSDHLHGDVALRTVVEEHNKSLAPGHSPILHQPLIRGARQVALDQHEDWMARLNFQRLHDTVLEGAARGWRSDLHGMNPVGPYAHGAGFGRGTKDKPFLY